MESCSAFFTFLQYVLDFGSALMAIFAAVCWYRTSKVKAPYNPLHPDNAKNDNYLPLTDQEGNDLVRLLPLQAKYNARAAVFAAIAAILQGAGIVLQSYIQTTLPQFLKCGFL